MTTVILYALLLWAGVVYANVEKVIFLGPTAILIPLEHPSLEDLYIASLSPHHPYWRTQLHAHFPSAEAPKGPATWLLLENLRAGQRYEVRICWAATQPTQFWLHPYTLPTVFEDPALTTSLALYSEFHQSLSGPPVDEEAVLHEALKSEVTPKSPDPKSVLFLQIFAAADYFTSNYSLMQNIPLVDVDIILDPYLLNVFPRSLLPTAAYITLLAIGGWYLSRNVWSRVNELAQARDTESTVSDRQSKKQR